MGFYWDQPPLKGKEKESLAAVPATVLANPEGRCAVRECPSECPASRGEGTLHSLAWLLSSAGCSGKGITMSEAALLLKQTLKGLGAI